MNAIRVFFETAIKNFAAAQVPPLAVAYEGAPFTKPTTAAYLETYLIPATTINPTVAGNRAREIGMFQVSVVCLDGKGSKEVDTISANIVALFPVTPKSTVSIEQTPSTGRAILNQDGHRVIPVTIKYRYEP